MNFQQFLLTMKNEWYGIDSLRLDKYLTLIRKMFYQIFLIYSNEKLINERNQIIEIINQFFLINFVLFYGIISSILACFLIKRIFSFLNVSQYINYNLLFQTNATYFIRNQNLFLKNI